MADAHLLEDENRRLREALEAIKVGHVCGKPYIGVVAAEGCWSVSLDDYDAQRLFGEWMKRRDAALAAEPVSGETNRPTICVGEHTIAKLRNREAVELSDAILLPADDLMRAAPPPPPTQGEEETARKLARQIATEHFGKEPIVAFPFENFCQKLIAAALRQRADEATRAENEAIAGLADRWHTVYGGGAHDIMHRFAAAIRARIEP